MSIQQSDFVPTKASLLKREPLKSYEETTFVAYKSKKKEKPKKQEIIEKESTENEFNIKKAKHEIMKFGISGFDRLRKEEAKIQLAIKLGAKPPKNKYKNYKELMAERTKEKEKLEKQEKFQQLGKNSMGMSTAKGKSFDRKRRKDGILDIYGKVTKEKTLEKTKGKMKKFK